MGGYGRDLRESLRSLPASPFLGASFVPCTDCDVCRMVEGSPSERSRLLSDVGAVASALGIADGFRRGEELPRAPAHLQHAYVMSMRLQGGSLYWLSARSALELPNLSGSDLLTLLGWVLPWEGGELEAQPRPLSGPRREAHAGTARLLASSVPPVRSDLLLSLAAVYADFSAWYSRSVEGPAGALLQYPDLRVSASGRALRLTGCSGVDARPVLSALRWAPLPVLETFSALAEDALASEAPLSVLRVWSFASELLVER